MPRRCSFSIPPWSGDGRAPQGKHRPHGLDRRHLRHGRRPGEAEIGQTSGIDFGPIDYVKYAEVFGVTGLMSYQPDDIAPVMKKAFETRGPVVVGVHVDYRDNH